MSAGAGVLATLFALGQLMHLSYDPQGNLDVFIYFQKDMATPSEIVLFLPGIEESPCVDTLIFSDRIGAFFSSRGKGFMLSFARLSSHMTPKGATIDPSQPKIEVDPLTNLIRISQLAALFGSSVVAGDYLKISIGSQYVFAASGLARVQVAGLLTYLWLSSPYTAFIPQAAFGQTRDLQARTLIQLLNLGNPALATLYLYNAIGILQKTLQLQISRRGSRFITNSDLLASTELATGWLRIEGARLAVATSFLISRCLLASLETSSRAGPVPAQQGDDDETCPAATLPGAAGVPASEPTNVFAVPIPGEEGWRTGFVLLNPTEDHMAHVHFALVDEATEEIVDESDAEVPAKNHVAQFVDELFPDQSEFKGRFVIAGSDVPLVAASINADSGGVIQSSSEVVEIGGQRLLPEQPDWIEAP